MDASKMKPNAGLVLGGGIVVLMVLFFVFCFRVVGVGETGIITRLGKVNRELSSGVHIKAPWPIEDLTRFDTRIQKEQIDAAASTIDLQDVTTTLAVNYNIDPTQVSRLFREVGVDWKMRILDPAIQEAFKSISAQYTASDLLTKRSEVKAKVLEKLGARLAERGIKLDDVSIVNFKFSAEFTKAIEQKQIAQQQAEQANFHLEQALKDAQAQQAQKTSLSAELLEKLAIDKWNGVMPQYVGSGSVFNIPLTK